MANLIITIISIGLVAVAAVMGAYYGGTAFVQGQSKAYANTAVTQGDQISAAWSVYAANNGGSYTGVSSIATLSSSPTYLASVPVAPPQVANSTSPSTWVFADLSAVATPTASTNHNGVYFRLTDDANGVNVCLEVSKIAAGTAASPTSISASTNLIPATTRKFDCVFFASVSTASTPPSASANPKFVYYRTY